MTWVCLTGIISCLNSLNVNVEGSCRLFFFFFFKGSEEISPQLKASIIKADVFSVFTL